MILERMSRELNLPEPFISNLATGASYEYRELKIRKRDGTIRFVYHPSRRLKALQRWLLLNVIKSLPVHVVATAYRRNISIWENARRHVQSKYLLRLDFQSFFESITYRDIQLYIASHETYFQGWSTQDIDIFCRLVCRNSALTIGAPTSPSLSNALCFELDQKLDGYCQSNEIIYSRYADDLFFSTRHRELLHSLETEVPKICISLRFPENLRLNLKKTRHSSKRGRRRVTGVVLGSDGKPYVGRTLKRRLRAQVHRLETLDDKQRASLSGLIAYVVGQDPDFINSLIKKYGLKRVQEAQMLPNETD